MISNRYVSNGYQQLTGLSAAKSLTVPAGTDYAVICAEAQNVRWRDDGVAPTASVGMLMRTTDIPTSYSGPIASLQFIEVVSGGVVNVCYYKNVG